MSGAMRALLSSQAPAHGEESGGHGEAVHDDPFAMYANSSFNPGTVGYCCASGGLPLNQATRSLFTGPSHDQAWINMTVIYPINIGPEWEHMFARGTQWFTFILSVLMFVWYVWNLYSGHCGWEVIYVSIVEFAKIIIEIFFEFDTPCLLYSVFGAVTPWLRYLEWLLTCPTILIHLSNITGLNEEYSPRTMSLITSDQGTILFGTTAAMAVAGWLKIVLFLIGVGFGLNTFYEASRVYIESYHQVPQGYCRGCVKVMAGLFFIAWTLFPLLFIAGPEGTGYLTWAGTTIGHTVADIASKNLWGIVGHHLQVKIREHILIHGDLVKHVEKTVAGHTFEVEEMADKDDDDAVEPAEHKYDRRNSFQLIGAKLEKGGTKLGLKLNNDEEEHEAGKMEMQMQPQAMQQQAMMQGYPGGMDPQQAAMMAQMQQMQMMAQLQAQLQQQQMMGGGGGGMSPMGSMMGMQQPGIQSGMMGQQPMMVQQPSMGGGMMGHQSPMQSMHSGMMMGGGGTPTGQMSPGQMSPGGPMYNQMAGMGMMPASPYGSMGGHGPASPSSMHLHGGQQL